MRRVASVTSLSETDPEQQRLVVAFRKGLDAAGWIEGRNVRIDYRFGGGDSSAMPRLKVFWTTVALSAYFNVTSIGGHRMPS